MSDGDENALLRDLLPVAAQKVERWGPQSPYPKQREFMALTCPEALFGGSAGPGKSSGLLLDALQYVHVPGYSALLLRKSFGDLSLEGGIMDRLQEWLRGDDRVRWRPVEKRFEFPAGSSITFGFCKHKIDLDRYFSSEFQYIGIDELTQWPEAWYRLLLSRLRKPKGMPVPLRMRGATNPGNTGHRWVGRRFGCDGKGPGQPGCVFVKALMTDNPSLDIEAYREMLSRLPPTQRRQLEHGEWVEDTEGLVYRYDAATNSTMKLPRPLKDPAWRFILAMDFGVANATAFVVLGWLPDDPTVYVIEVQKHEDMHPSAAAEEVTALSKAYRFSRIIGDVGGLGKAFAQEMTVRFRIPIEAAEKHNKMGYQRIMNGDLARGRIKVLLPACEPLVTEWAELPKRPDSDQEAEGYANHACLVAGTLVETPRGLVPIEHIAVGDLVQTRLGPRPVRAAWCTGVKPTFRVETDDGRAIEGTWDHPIWTETGWQHLALLTPDSMVSGWQGEVRGSTGPASRCALMGSSSGDTRSHLGASLHCTFCAPPRPATAGRPRGSTLPCGSPSTAGALAASTSTTRTATHSTTTSTTSSCSRPANTPESTSRQSGERCREKPLWSGPFQPPAPGTAVPRAEHGTASTPRMRGWAAQSADTSVWSADGASSLAERRRPSAPTTASQSSGALAALTTRTVYALSAARRTAETSTTSPEAAALVRVRRVEATGFALPVYDLTVAEAHEFVANGFIVSNSDATLYGFRAAGAFLETEPTPPLPPEERLRIAEEEAEARDEAECIAEMKALDEMAEEMYLGGD